MDRETGIRLWRVGNVLSCLGVVQFLALTALAMSCYPGGTMQHHRTVGYSFYENFLSDLGRLTAWSGAPNRTSMWLFNGSLVLLAASLVPFFWFLPMHAPDRRWLLRAAAALGFVSTMAMIGIALTPYDVALDGHNTALIVWWGTSFAAVTVHFVALFLSAETPQRYAWLSFGLAVLLGGYAGQGTPAAQKYVVLYDLAWFFLFSWRTARSDAVRPEQRPRELQDAAEEYLRRMTGQTEEEDKPAKE